MKQNNGLQFLRFIAAGLVLLVHLPTYALFPFFAGEHRTLSGAIGVDVFFCISGLVMYLSVGNKSGARFAAQFAIRRVFRVVPLYFLLTLILFGLLSVRSGDFSTLSACLGKSMMFTYCENNGAYADPIIPMGWSLNYEMFFYFLLLVGLLIFKQNVLQYVAIGLTALALSGWISNDRIYYVNSIIIEFTFGILLGMYGDILRRKISTSVAVVLASLVVALFLLAMLGTDGPESDLSAVPRMLIHFDTLGTWPRWIAWGIPSLFLCATCYWLGNKVPASIAKWGDFSYSVYLSQVLVIALYGTALKFALKSSGLTVPTPSLLHSFGILVSTFLVAYVLYYLVEMPWMMLGKKLSAKTADKTDAAAIRL